METKKTIGLVLGFCLISALVMAEASNEKEAGQKHKGPDVSASRQRGGSVPRVSPGRRGTPKNHRQAYQEMLAKRRANHKQALAELEEIKKIAKEEGATRTAEAIQKMIDKKDAEFKQKMEQFEQQRRERSKRVQQRTEKPTRKEAAETAKQKVAEDK